MAEPPTQRLTHAPTCRICGERKTKRENQICSQCARLTCTVPCKICGNTGRNLYKGICTFCRNSAKVNGSKAYLNEMIADEQKTLLLLEELETTKAELETQIACEKLEKPKISDEFMTYWLCRFRKLDMQKKAHRKVLIDTFVNSIYLYDDKMLITFNYKDGNETITFDDVRKEAPNGASCSDLDCLAAPSSLRTAYRSQRRFMLRMKRHFSRIASQLRADAILQ